MPLLNGIPVDSFNPGDPGSKTGEYKSLGERGTENKSGEYKSLGEPGTEDKGGELRDASELTPLELGEAQDSSEPGALGSPFTAMRHSTAPRISAPIVKQRRTSKF